MAKHTVNSAESAKKRLWWHKNGHPTKSGSRVGNVYAIPIKNGDRYEWAYAMIAGERRAKGNNDSLQIVGKIFWLYTKKDLQHYFYTLCPHLTESHKRAQLAKMRGKRLIMSDHAETGCFHCFPTDAKEFLDDQVILYTTRRVPSIRRVPSVTRKQKRRC